MRLNPFNVELLRNPYNWLVVGFMVAILGLSLHLIFGPHPTHDGIHTPT